MPNQEEIKESLRKKLRPETTAPVEATDENTSESTINTATTPVLSSEKIDASVPTGAVASSIVMPAADSTVGGNFVSDALSAFSESLDNEQSATVETGVPGSAPVNVLSTIKVDLTSIELSANPSEMDILQNQSLVFEAAKRTMQVVCCQSAYSAEMSAFRGQEIQNISDSNLDFYNYKKRVYNVLWKHIEQTSVGKMDFPTWMKVTSYFDLDTLLFGAYCQTFPYENKYSLMCPKPDCRMKFEATVNNQTLIETRGREEEIFSKINEVIAGIVNSQDLVAKSHVHTTKRISLDESKIIIDMYIPSVFDYLNGVLSNMTDEIADELSQSIGAVLFIKTLYLPDIAAYKRTGKLSFIPITDRAKLLEIVSTLSNDDMSNLLEQINEFTDRLRVSYAIQKVVCPKCGNELGNVPISMEDMLFIAIRQGRREKKEQKATSNT